MKCLALAILLSSSAAAWAADGDLGLPPRMSLDDDGVREQQDFETEPQRPTDESNRLTPMEFFYRHSELEVGIMYQTFSSELDLKSHMAFYLRYGVEILPHLSLHVTYRYNEFGNGPTSDADDVRLQALFFGAGLRIPLHPEFAFIVGGGIGPMWFDSSAAGDELGYGVNGEAALTAQLWSMLRLKAGLMIEGVDTDFQNAGFSVNLSYIVGLEIGM